MDAYNNVDQVLLSLKAFSLKSILALVTVAPVPEVVVGVGGLDLAGGATKFIGF